MSLDVQKITGDVYFITTKDYHRPLFDNLMPLEEGTSYNAYIIKGETKNVLIDTTYPPFVDEFCTKLSNIGIDKVDYIVSLHAEQDHSGGLPAILAKYPNANIITNKKCQEITMGFLPLKEDDFILVEDNEVIDIGGKTLQFMFAPWVHWPETMFAFLKEDGILFSTDFFGAHATNFDGFWDDDEVIIPLAKGYYAEIMMPYATFVKKHLEKIENLDMKYIAPSHGPIYKNPDFIINLYKKWTEEKQNKVIILGVTMYGSTQKMIDFVKEKLQNYNIEVVYYDAVDMDSSIFASDLVDAMGLIIACPTVLSGPHPMVVPPVYLANLLKPELKYIGIMGSYSWGTAMERQLQEMLKNLRTTEIIDPVIVKGLPKEPDYQQLLHMVEKINELHKK